MSHDQPTGPARPVSPIQPSTAQPTTVPAEPVGRSVLVVDDDDTQRYVLSTWLRRAGFTVVEAGTGAEGLRVASSGDFDVVVLDVRLPDMSGLEVSRQLKAGSRTAALSILHVSAVAVEVSDRSAGLDQGADAYLVNPIEPQEFISTVRALQRQARARQEAERRLFRLRQLSEATTRVTLAVGDHQLAAAAAEGLASLVGGPAVVVLLGTANEAMSGYCRAPDRSAEASGAEPTAARRLLAALPEPSAPVELVGADWLAVLPGGEPAGSPRVDERRFGGQRWVVQPVQRRGGEPVGLLALPHHLGSDPDDAVLVRQLAESVAVTHENRRLFAEEHRIALTLQRSLLPATLPTLSGLQLTARYQASNEQAEIGGDFFDAFETPDGCAIVVIGDVQGHSLTAAVLMGELRHALRAYAEDGHPPAEILRRLNRLLLRHHPNTIATLCIVQFAVDRSAVTVANAGHIPPLVACEGRSHYVDYGGPLLGVPARPHGPRIVPFPAGTRLLLITDGLIERRDRSLQVDLDTLAADFAADDRGIEAVGDALMARPRQGGDDAALVLVEHTTG